MGTYEVEYAAFRRMRIEMETIGEARDEDE